MPTPDGMPSGTDGVDPTALAVAAARAIESSRPDPLVTDPFAARLAAGSTFPLRWPEPDEAIDPAQVPLLVGAQWIALRTRAIDDALAAWQAEAPRPAQVVLLGSGLDTRAWRLAWAPGTRVYELDRATVHTAKYRALTGAVPTAEPVPVVADLAGGWDVALRAAGHDDLRPTWWVVEGLLPYLSRDAAGTLLRVIGGAAPGSRAVLEPAVPIPDTPEARARLAEMALATGVPLDTLLTRTDPPDPAAVLAATGWQVEHLGVDDLQIRYRRSLRDPLLAPLLPPSGERGPSRAGLVLASLD